ncbi:hypothetical protein IEO21_00632 [Rhodonia placenta]|uniref:Carboxylesterase type B domain-containing protein n=1 Tax=Rhodonia placenta TaxID=104341 RepID=A0A8H7PB12_9APHY|nr:hypothetical protein IEO21_00632 [Postia placenta]
MAGLHRVTQFLGLLGTFGALSTVTTASQTYPDTDVVIVSNNDLNPSNPNRASALYLKSGFTCTEAYDACSQFQETLLLAPNSTGLTAANLSVALTSEKHGAALDTTQPIWIAGSGTRCKSVAQEVLYAKPSPTDSTECAVFTPSYQYAGEYQMDASADANELLPVLCTNSAPLTRSNVTSYDTTRQIRLTTPSAGVLYGYRDKFTYRFLGIKYADSTAGEGRFQPPTAYEVEPSTERSAVAYGTMCAQPPDADNGHLLYTDEDCMYLNVFTPVVKSGTVEMGFAPKLPVMFFIHGGGLNTGDSGPFPFNMTTSGFVGNSISNIYDGTNLVSYGGVVLVTINYRLTAFGWFNASNAALKDALLALHWVQDNIEAFGGDPTKVLIYGESAGGTMTRYLLGTNPAYTDGLFSAAVLESDFGQGDPFLVPVLANNNSLKIAQYLGCADNSSTTFTDTMASCVQAQPAGDIAMASYNMGLSWSIAIDGDYVLNDIASSIMDGLYARVPTIWSSNDCEYCYFLPTTIAPNSSASVFPDNLSITFNSTQAQRIMEVANTTDLWPYQTAPAEDGISGAVLQLAHLITDWEVHCPMVYLSSLETNTTNPGNSYKVVFTVGLGSPLTPNPATCPGQVCHADELYWVFATAETDNLYQPLTESQVITTREAINRWTSLAWNGNPNYEGAVVEWPPYTGDNEVVINATATETIEPYRVAQCDFLESQLGLVFGEHYVGTTAKVACGLSIGSLVNLCSPTDDSGAADKHAKLFLRWTGPSSEPDHAVCWGSRRQELSCYELTGELSKARHHSAYLVHGTRGAWARCGLAIHCQRVHRLSSDRVLSPVGCDHGQVERRRPVQSENPLLLRALLTRCGTRGHGGRRQSSRWWAHGQLEGPRGEGGGRALEGGARSSIWYYTAGCTTPWRGWHCRKLELPGREGCWRPRAIDRWTWSVERRTLLIEGGARPVEGGTRPVEGGTWSVEGGAGTLHRRARRCWVCLDG